MRWFATSPTTATAIATSASKPMPRAAAGAVRIELREGECIGRRLCGPGGAFGKLADRALALATHADRESRGMDRGHGRAPGDEAQLAGRVVDERCAAFHPVAVVVIAKALGLDLLGTVDVPADDAVAAGLADGRERGLPVPLDIARRAREA